MRNAREMSMMWNVVEGLYPLYRVYIPRIISLANIESPNDKVWEWHPNEKYYT